MRIAVIGGGAAGLAAAWTLSKRHETVLYEAADYVGGHANTIDIGIAGRQIPVDTGFIVYNERNYPNLTSLFRTIGVKTEDSDMSFSASLDAGRVEYFGSPLGMFAQPTNLCRPDHWRMLRDIRRFGKEARALLADRDCGSISMGALLARNGFSDAFARNYLLPMASAIWSSTLETILDFPARSFLRFFASHGLLDLKDRPQWRTVSGGSREYVKLMIETGDFAVRPSTPVRSIERRFDGVTVRTGTGDAEHYDEVVMATPADRTAAILGADASQLERKLLSAIRYLPNRAVVHADTRLMPKRRRVWASWNYLARDDGDDASGIFVSYWMNRLQNLPVSRPVIVTLNPVQEPASDLVFDEFLYRHPQFDLEALEAQDLLPMIQGVNRTWFCGSYCGYGFHEDAMQAGFAVAGALGSPAPWADDITPRSPAAYTVGQPQMAAAE